MINMERQLIQTQISKMEMSINPQIVEQIEIFLKKHFQPFWMSQPTLHVPAAAAIICETFKLPTIGSQGYTSTGIKIENVMRHLVGVRKEEFLQALDFQICRSISNNHALNEKVQHLKISLRIFKKYKEIFEELSKKTQKQSIPELIKEDLLALFWIIFLLLKHQLGILEDISISTKVMIVLLEQVFSVTISHHSLLFVRNILYSPNNFGKHEISEEERKKIVSEYQKILYNCLNSRNAAHLFNCEKLKQNIELLKRIIDDLSLFYEKIYVKLPQGRYIEEITFLQLSKNLTPQAFRVKKMDNISPITKILKFDDELDEEQTFQAFKQNSLNQTIKKQPIMNDEAHEKSIAKNLFHPLIDLNAHQNIAIPKPKPVQSLMAMSPLTWGITKGVWVKKLIKQGKQRNEEETQKILTDTLINYSSFKEYCQERISNQVEEMTSHALDKQSQKISIWHLFISFLKLFHDKTVIPLKNCMNFLRSLACLSGCLYNYTMRSLNCQFNKYLKYYDIQVLDSFQVIYLTGKQIQIPTFIQQYLYQLQKQVTIKQLWETNHGYILLQQGQNSENQIIFKRLYKHIYERIRQICLAIHIDNSLVQKIEKFVCTIMTEYNTMFVEAKLDQIILCSIACIIGCNNCDQLDVIFYSYTFTPKTNANEMTLLKYFNYVFLVEVSQLLEKEEYSMCLSKPLLETDLKKRRNIKLCIPPISKIEANPFTDRKSLKLGGCNNNYQQKALEKIRKKFPQSPKIEDQQSPSFVRLKRTMTFGKDQIQ